MKRSTWIHVCPSWIAGPRSAHPKFGGGAIIGGITRVEDRLLEIKQRFPNDRSSGHVCLEVASDHSVLSPLNNSNAIGFRELIGGMKDGRFPLWSAMTSPAFGWRGCENGVLLSNSPAITDIGEFGHNTAITWSKELFDLGLGLNHNIWWPAFDAHLHRGPLSLISRQQAHDTLIGFWVYTLRDTDALMHFEYKPSVPGQRDWYPTMEAAIDFCEEVNNELGRKAMFVNLEWAHALIGGQTVEDATRLQIAAGLFSGFLHVNSAELAMVEWNDNGTEIVEGSPGDDADWPVGEGGDDIWNDQQAAVSILDRLGIEITAEHDIDPAGEDPMECYARSRGHLEQMITNVREDDYTLMNP